MRKILILITILFTSIIFSQNIVVKLKDGTKIKAKYLEFRPKLLHIDSWSNKKKIEYNKISTIDHYNKKKQLNLTETIFIDQKGRPLRAKLVIVGECSFYYGVFGDYGNAFKGRTLIVKRKQEQYPTYLAGPRSRKNFKKNVLNYFKNCRSIHNLKLKKKNIEMIVKTYNSECSS